MTRLQSRLSWVFIVLLLVLFVGMWGPTPFGFGQLPSASDGTDPSGFPIRASWQPSGFGCVLQYEPLEMIDETCGRRRVSYWRLAVDGAVFVAAAAGGLRLIAIVSGNRGKPTESGD